MPRLPWAITDLNALGSDSFLERATQQIADLVKPPTPVADLTDQPQTAASSPAPQTPSLSFDLADWTPWRTQPAEPKPEAAAPSAPSSFDEAGWFPWRTTKTEPPTATSTATPSASTQPAARPTGASGTPSAMPTGQPSSSGAPETLGDIAEGDPQAFFATAGPYARRVERDTGIPAALTLAVAANETGYGQRRYMAGNNNYFGIQAQPGEAGAVPYKDWRPGPNGEQQFYNAAQRSFADPLAAFYGFASFLQDNPRYGPALARYRQTGDVNQLAADIKDAGYAEDPQYATKIQSIMRGIPVSTGVGEVTAPAGVSPTSQNAPAVAVSPPARPSAGASSEQRTGDLTPDQSALDDPDKWSLCGPVAAVAMARAKGKNWSVADAKALAQQNGLWNASQGMGGLAAEAGLLNRMGVAARSGGADWGAITSDVSGGNPVTLSTDWTPGGHYVVLEKYDPQTGQFYVGGTGNTLKATTGRSKWMTIQEMQQLGAVNGALYMDNPATPAPSVAAGAAATQDAYKTGADLPDTGLSAGDQKRAKLAAANGQQDMLRAPLGPSTSGPDTFGTDQAPAPSSGGPEIADVRDADSGPHELPPPDLQQTPPAAYGQSQDDPGTAPLPFDVPQYTYLPSSAPLVSDQANSVETPVTRPGAPVAASYGASQDDPGTTQAAPPRVEQAGMPAPSGFPGLQAVYDSAGNFLHWIQGAADQIGQNVQGNRQAVEDANQGQEGGVNFGEGARRAYEAARPYVSPGLEMLAHDRPQGPLSGLAYDMTSDVANLPRNAASIPGAVVGSLQHAWQATLDEAAATGQALSEGDVKNALWSGAMLGLTELGAPFEAGSAAINAALPSSAASMPVSPGTLVNTISAPHDVAMAARGIVKTARSTPEMLGRLRDLGQQIATGSASAIDRGIEAGRGVLTSNAERVAQADARMAEAGSTALPGTLGVISNNPLEANTVARSRIIPPDVADTLDFPLRPPTDPAVIRAIEAAGGSVDPERGVNLNLIRYQGPEAHGQAATRASTFYTADRPGAPSPYQAGQGAQVGGSERIEGPTRYRSPLVLSDAPGDAQGFEQGMRQLGVENPDRARLEQAAAAANERLRAARDAMSAVEKRHNETVKTLGPLEAKYGRWFPSDTSTVVNDPPSPEWARAWDSMVAVDREYAQASRAIDSAAMEQSRAQRALEATSSINRQINTGIEDARRSGPPGSPERAQALKDLVSRYGGDPGVIDDLLRVRGADDSESAWAIKENILASNARRQGYDGVLTVQKPYAENIAVGDHPNVIAAEQALNAANDAMEKAADAHQAAYDAAIPPQFVRGPNESLNDWYARVHGPAGARNAEYDRAIYEAQRHPSVLAAEQEVNRTADAVQEATAAYEKAVEDARAERSTPRITELADFRESHNPTPGAPNPKIRELQKALKAAEKALSKVPNPTHEQIVAATTAVREAQAQLFRTRSLEPYTGEAGYTLRPDIPRRGGETTAQAAAGVAPQTAAPDRLAAVNRVLGQGIMSSVSGGVGAQVNQQMNPDDPYAGVKGFAAGALLPVAAARGAGAIARRVGALSEREGGALATFGASPNYHGPSAAQVQQAAQQGARRGEMLNRAVTPPGSSVPRGVRAATQVTDDRAALRWAEDMLTDTAGSPRLPADSPQRPSTMSRVNAASVGNERLASELEPALVKTARAGLQHELPQYLEDMHHRDILDDFYNRGYQETMDARAQAIANAQAQNRPAAVIQRMQQKAQADADAAGVARMRQRQGSNADHAYEATDARLQAQEARLKADGRWQDLQDAAQAVWDHNATTRDRLVQAGEMDAQQAADLAQRYPHYVPTVPLSHLEMGGPTVGPTSTVTRGTTPVVRALDDVGTGGERLNPIVATRNATLRAERAIQRNQVASAFADLFEQAQKANPQALAPGAGPKNIWNGDTDVSFFRNGQPMTIRVPRPVADGLEAASNMGMSANAVTAAWKRVTAAVAQTLTASRATFLPVNLIRDFQDYAATTAIREGGAHRLPGVVGAWLDQAGNAAVDVLRAQANARGAGGAAIGAITGAAQGDENTTPGERVRHAVEGAVAGTLLLGANKVRATGASREFLARGGGMGVAPTSFRAGERWYRDLLAQGGVGIRTPGEAARYLGDWLSDIASLQGVRGINERTELISRTAAMRRADAAGAGPTEAMIAGRDASVDFERGGALVRAINGFIPFTNASVQGSAQLVRLLKRNPPAAATTIAATTALPLLAAEAWNRSDPQRAQVYDDVPDYAKNTGMVVVMPWAGSDSRGERPNWLWIPTGNLTPFVIGMRAAMQDLPGLEPTASTLHARGDSEAQRWAGVLGNVLEAFSPVRGDSLGSAASAMIPPVAKQAIELGMNRDIFRGSDIVTNQADERASAASKAVAGGLNEAGRRVGNDWLQNVHPSAIEYLIRQPAAYGDLVTGASDMAAPSGEKQAEQRPVQNEPFVGGMLGRFIRDTGGGNLGRARDNRLTDETRSVLQEAGMRPEDVLPVGGTWKNGPLNRDEQVAWQEAMNDEVDRAMLRVRQNPRWRNPTTQEAAVREALATARENAARRAHLPSEAEMQRRIRDAQSRKAS